METGSVDEFDNGSDDSLSTAEDLCPHCDEPLPPTESRSPQLQSFVTLVESMYEELAEDPSAAGRLMGPFTASIRQLCGRHKLESKLLPQATQNDWPKAINFIGVHQRAVRMSRNHTSLLHNITQNAFLVSVREEIQSRRRGSSHIQNELNVMVNHPMYTG